MIEKINKLWIQCPKIMMNGQEDSKIVFQAEIHVQGIFVFFLLIILFIYISNDIPLPGFLSTTSSSHPRSPSSLCFYEGAPSLTPTSLTYIPLH